MITEEEGYDESKPPPPSVVRKLLNTAMKNLLTHDENTTIKPKPPSDSRKIFLSGLLSVFALFFTDEASRSILFRIAGSTDTITTTATTPDGPTTTQQYHHVLSLVDAILECLMIQNKQPYPVLMMITLHCIYYVS